jgi:transcriptional regulator with XRE-family HTH domain
MIREELSMYTHARRSDPDVQELRRVAGEWLRKLREQRGLSQRDLAKLVGAEYYTFISQLEMGRGRVPPDRYKVWADALRVTPKTFVKTLLRYYDPITYNILFDGEVLNEASQAGAAG